MSDPTELTIYTDGGSRGNPGPAAYAFVILRPGLPDVQEKVYLGSTTNNIAEYTGLVRALEHARELGGRRLTVYSDSELMVRQMNGQYKVKNAGLLPLYQQAVRLRDAFDSVKIEHVRREFNKHADRLCNEALDHPEDHEPLPIFEREKKPVPLPAAKEATSAAAADDIHARAAALLAEHARAWARGDAAEPDPAAVWDELWRMLRKAKVVRVTKKKL